MRSNITAMRAVALVSMWGGWLGSAALGLWSILEYDPNHGHFAPQWVGLAFIFLIGVAIAGTSSAARFRMAETIVGAFKAGLGAQDKRDDERRADRKDDDK